LIGFNLESEEVIEKISDLNITHLHGKLHELEHFYTNGREYGEFEITDGLVADCAGSIKIFTEAKPANIAFRTAIAKMRNSKLVYFLGFGYDEVNLLNLEIPKTIKYKEDRGQSISFKGTALDENPNKMISINNKYFKRDFMLQYKNLTAQNYLNSEKEFQKLKYY